MQMWGMVQSKQSYSHSSYLRKKSIVHRLQDKNHLTPTEIAQLQQQLKMLISKTMILSIWPNHAGIVGYAPMYTTLEWIHA